MEGSLLELNNGVEMPALGFGVFQTPPEETAEAVATALQTGYRLIDTAAAYMNESAVGEAMRSSGLDRSEVFIETKVWISDFGYDETLHAFDKSSRKLGVDVIDLFILTRRSRATSTAPLTPTGRWSGSSPRGACARSG